jgi:nicotinate-nucleotide--dimethylbenzimidazole phosphoribosyltransferase
MSELKDLEHCAVPIEDAALRARVQQRLDTKTKPLGALGRLENLAMQVALVQRTTTPRLEQPQLVVFAADHGVATRGVSAYPSAVTAQMVVNMLTGGAAVSVLAQLHALDLTVVDCGVDADFAPHTDLRILKVAGSDRGTADCCERPALTGTQCRSAIENGRALVASLPGNVLLLGEMGIANTSAAALLMAVLTGLPLQTCVGRGTGLDDAGLTRKLQVLERALVRTGLTDRSPVAWLAEFGGLEIATMVGAIQHAARERRVVLVDGFVTTAAVAVCAALDRSVLGYCVFSHCSAERGHAAWLENLGAVPLLQLGMRLGEGSGAALAWPVLRSACALLEQMASFETAGVSGRQDA